MRVAPPRLPLPNGPAVRRGVAWINRAPGALMALGVVVGVGAGSGAVVFRWLILEFTRLFSGYSDYSAVGHRANPNLPALGVWFVVLAPVVGGAIYGPLISRFAKEARGHGVPEVMLAVAESGGRIRPQVAVVKSLASALCIGSGGSVGREGPIVQIGSALGSSLGQWLGMPESRMRLLVACGAAGGISATFNAPIAGVFFALELILRDFQVESFGVVVLSSVTADVIGRAAFGSQPFLTLPAFQQQSGWEYVLYAALGVSAALVGIGFIRVLYGFEDIADRLWRGRPEWLRPIAGGVLLGGLLLALPQLYGVGYPVLQHAVGGGYTVWFLLGLMAGKMVATSLTIAIGGSGGVFAPSLFIGAMLGTAYGDVVHRLIPALTGPAGAYGLVGMGAVFAGAARAPITALIIIFEMTGDYRIILPLMVAIVIATAVGQLLQDGTIYSIKLRRRGIDLDRPRATRVMAQIAIGQAMRPLPPPVATTDALDVVVGRFATSALQALPVFDGEGVYQGVITAAMVDQAIHESPDPRAAGSLVRDVPPVTEKDTLEVALDVLIRRDVDGLPVAADSGELTGWLTHKDVLRAYHHHIDRAAVRAASARPRAGLRARSWRRRSDRARTGGPI